MGQIFVRAHTRANGVQVSGYVKASGPYSPLRGMADMRTKTVRKGGKALTRLDQRKLAKIALGRARQIQAVRLQAISRRVK